MAGIIKSAIFLTCALYVIADMSMTEELLMAQNELSIAHEFTELYLMNQKETWVGNLTMLTEEDVLPGFFDAREEIISIIDATTAFIDSFESSTCRNEVQRRWQRQATIVGNRLQTCMREAKRIIGLEFEDLNLHHPNAQQLAAHTPNQSLNILSRSSIFDPSGTIHRVINNRLRTLLGRASPWLVIMDELEEQFAHHVITARTMVRRCYIMIVNNFQSEADSHRQRVSDC